jgi:hypothetical protein
MKTKFFLMPLLAIGITVVLCFAFFSCASSPKEKWPPIDPSVFVGTKWTSAQPKVITLSIEIINEKECLFTLAGTQYQTPYTINHNIFTLPDFNESWELRGNTFYNSKGTPFFVKE